jgi:hypothetical protein
MPLFSKVFFHGFGFKSKFNKRLVSQSNKKLWTQV